MAIAALVLAGINVFTLRGLSLIRRRSVFQLEHILGATRSWRIRDYLSRTLLLILAMMVMVGVFAAGGYVIFRHLLPNGPVWKLLTGNHVLLELAWVLPALIGVVAVGESLSLGFLLLREELTEMRSVGLHREDRSLGTGVLIAEAMLAVVMSCAAAWALVFAWQQRHVDLGMQHASATVLSIQHKHTQSMAFSGNLNHEVQSNALLLGGLRQAVTRIQPGSRIATGPTLGFAAEFGYAAIGPSVTYTAGKSTIKAEPFDATANWLNVSGARLLAGRNFDESKPNASEVLIDTQVARALYGSVRAALGRSLAAARGVSHAQQLRVLGIIAPLLLAGPNHAALPVVIGDLSAGAYSPFAIIGGPLLIRPAIPVARYPQLRTAIEAVLKHQAPQLKLHSIQSSAQVLDKLTSPQTRQARVFLAIALFAWAIALSGVAAHLRLYLATRKRLTALRSALGAGPSQLYREVVLGVLALAGAGVVLALLAVPWLATQFALLSGAQVAPFGVATWIALAVLLLAVFAVAHFPARRAARAEPAESLHEL